MQKITQLPTPPTREDPSSFDERADKFLSALPPFGAELSALSAELERSLDFVKKTDKEAREIKQEAQAIKEEAKSINAQTLTLKNQTEQHKKDTQNIKSDCEGIRQAAGELLENRKEYIKTNLLNIIKEAEKIERLKEEVLTLLKAATYKTKEREIIRTRFGDYGYKDITPEEFKRKFFAECTGHTTFSFYFNGEKVITVQESGKFSGNGEKQDYVWRGLYANPALWNNDTTITTRWGGYELDIKNFVGDIIVDNYEPFKNWVRALDCRGCSDKSYGIVGNGASHYYNCGGYYHYSIIAYNYCHFRQWDSGELTVTVVG